MKNIKHGAARAWGGGKVAASSASWRRRHRIWDRRKKSRRVRRQGKGAASAKAGRQGQRRQEGQCRPLEMGLILRVATTSPGPAASPREPHLHTQDGGSRNQNQNGQTRPELKARRAEASPDPEHPDRKCAGQTSAPDPDSAAGGGNAGGGGAERPEAPDSQAGVAGTRRIPLTRWGWPTGPLVPARRAESFSFLRAAAALRSWLRLEGGLEPSRVLLGNVVVLRSQLRTLGSYGNRSTLHPIRGWNLRRRQGDGVLNEHSPGHQAPEYG